MRIAAVYTSAERVACLETESVLRLELPRTGIGMPAFSSVHHDNPPRTMTISLLSGNPDCPRVALLGSTFTRSSPCCRYKYNLCEDKLSIHIRQKSSHTCKSSLAVSFTLRTSNAAASKSNALPTLVVCLNQHSSKQTISLTFGNQKGLLVPSPSDA